MYKLFVFFKKINKNICVESIRPVKMAGNDKIIRKVV